MASVNEINIEDKNQMHYYDPKENTKVSLIPKQLYPMNAKKVDIREVSVKGKYKAKVYNVIYEIAKECSQYKFPSENGEINGSSFVGKTIYSQGIFMFLNPKEGDTFEANNGANEKYLRFCETINGETRMVKQFPELQSSEIIGKPILGFIDIVEYVKDGETKRSYKVKDFAAWTDGKVKDFVELPF